MRTPPTREQWLLDGEMNGHTSQEVMQYWSWVSDFEDWQVARRRQPGFVLPQVGPWWRGWKWLRRI